MKDQIVAGDTLNFLTSVPAYPASAGWVLTFKLIPRVVATGPVLSFSASAEGDDHRVNVVAATTAGWALGDYSWQSYVTKAAERYTAAFGSTKIVANPATAASLDNRSHERKVLEAIEACIENRASTSQREMVAYTIGNRSQQFDTTESKSALLELHSKYKWLVANEDARAAIAAGRPNPRLVRVRFGSA
jgi:hypothetical protein